MCNNHVEKYVNDEASRKLYEILLRRALGFTDLFEKAKFALFWLIHHIANFRVYHVEHFPLESLFLYHIRRIKKEISACRKRSTSKSEFLSKAKKLIPELETLKVDFSSTNNVYLYEIENIIARFNEAQPSTNLNDYLTSAIIKSDLVFEPKKFLAVLILVFLMSSALVAASFQHKFRIKTFFDFNYIYVLLYSCIAYFWALSGIKYQYSIDQVTKVAFRKQLYKKSQNNITFLQIAHRIKSNLIKFHEFRLGQKGLAFGAFSVGAFEIFKGSELSTFEFILSLGFNALLFWVFYPLFLLYPTFTSTSSLVWHMPKQDFKIDIYKVDKSLGITELVQMLKSYFIFNSSSLLIIWFSIPALFKKSDPDYLLITFLYLIGVLRVRSVRMSLRAFRGIQAEFVQAKAEEIDKIETLSLDDKIIRHDFLKSVTFSPFNLKWIAKVAFYFFTTVLIPIAILLAEKNWSIISEIIESLSKFISESGLFQL